MILLKLQNCTTCSWKKVIDLTVTKKKYDKCFTFIILATQIIWKNGVNKVADYYFEHSSQRFLAD